MLANGCRRKCAGRTARGGGGHFSHRVGSNRECTIVRFRTKTLMDMITLVLGAVLGAAVVPETLSEHTRRRIKRHFETGIAVREDIGILGCGNAGTAV
jgi:hypothetical protein